MGGKFSLKNWNSENKLREINAMRRYNLENRNYYKKYNKLCGLITKLIFLLKKLPTSDLFRNELTERILSFLEILGVIPVKKSINQLEKLSVSSFFRRRLAVIIVKMKMVETLQVATILIKHGHVRVGPETITNPSA